MTPAHPRRLAVIHTGGTIASRPNPHGPGVTPQAAPSVPGLQGVSISEFQPFTLPSPHVTPAHMLVLARLIAEVAPAHEAVVVTHGTDTMVETARALATNW